LGCEVVFESEPTEVADVTDIVDVADIEPKLVEVVDVKLEDVVLAVKIHPFI
jgi:hypothetical protein